MATSSQEHAPSTSTSGDASWFPVSDREIALVRQQLDRILADPAFSSSKRYPRLLRYIVEETLQGRGAQLKERTLGIEVFGREPCYDTNQDPIVRTSAAQVRQRVAQYYREPPHERELRIELMAGSYMPQFRQPEITSSGAFPETTEQISSPDVLPPAPIRPSAPTKRGVPIRYLRLTAVVVAAIGIVVFAARLIWSGSDPVAAFWGPVWDAKKAVVICVPGSFPREEQNPQQPMTIAESLRLNSIAWPDATTTFALASLIQAHGQAYHFRRAGDSALEDLRTGPTVLVGGINNPWLLRLNERLRFTYRFEKTAEKRYGTRGWIEDSQQPGKREWMVHWSDPYSSFLEDYGIVSRVWDSTTENLVVTASGIASYGTIAAGDFLTTPKYLALIGEKAPPGWQKKSIQVVFSTRVFNGNAGPPRILAVHVW